MSARLFPDILSACVLFLLATASSCSPLGDPPRPPCEPIRYASYLITSVDLPRTAQEAEDLGHDMNGDGQPDNALASAMVNAHTWIYQSDGEPFEVGANQSLPNRALWIAQIGRCDTAPSFRALSLVQGEDRDRDGAPEVVSRAEVAFGESNSEDAAFVMGGAGAAPMSIFFDPLAQAPIAWLPVANVLASFPAHDDDEIELELAFAVPNEEVSMVAANSYVVEANREPGALALFDADGSGEVTVDEIFNHRFVQATLRNPDLDLFDSDGARSDGDGVDESSSFGLAVQAQSIAIDVD